MRASSISLGVWGFLGCKVGALGELGVVCSGLGESGNVWADAVVSGIGACAAAIPQPMAAKRATPARENRRCCMEILRWTLIPWLLSWDQLFKPAMPKATGCLIRDDLTVRQTAQTLGKIGWLRKIVERDLGPFRDVAPHATS